MEQTRMIERYRPYTHASRMLQDIPDSLFYMSRMSSVPHRSGLRQDANFRSQRDERDNPADNEKEELE